MTNNPLSDLIKSVVHALDEAGITYAITGSVASSVHGELVTSLDVDFVVRMTPAQAAEVAETLPQRFYRSQEALVEAANSNGFANLIDNSTGLKVDLSVMKPTSFHDQIMLRAENISFGGPDYQFRVVTPEDIVLMKLEWRKVSQSTKQWENALGVVRTQGLKLDWGYLFAQAKQLDIVDDLAALRDEAGI